MDKVNLAQLFASRLHDAMIAKGYNSQRSTSGVCIHKLAEITGYSVQICRKYLKGEAIPEPLKLAELAAKLNVSAGWLLFGDADDDSIIPNNKITINKDLLLYIFTKAAGLYHSDLKEIPDFLMDLIKDLNIINTDLEQSKKIVDLALASVKYFNH